MAVLLLCAVTTCASFEKQTHTLLCPMEVSKIYHGLFANCSGLNLTKVPIIKGNITALDLSENEIELTERDFDRYPYLLYLNLEGNGLSKLPSYVFAGCGKLKLLNLKNNDLNYTFSSFPENVFNPLQELEVLNIGKNNVRVTFPDIVIKSLKHLRSLVMDTSSNVTFGNGFANLRSLEVLCLSGKEANCGIVELYNHTFSVFSSSKLQTLDLSFCGKLKQIHLDSFTPLVSLKVLNMTKASNLGLTNALLGLYGLQNRNMTAIDLEGIKFPITISVTKRIEDQMVTKEKLKYMLNICVSRLNLSNNQLFSFDFQSVENTSLISCLQYLSIRGNLFYGDVTTDGTMQILPKLKLIFLDASSNQWRGNLRHNDLVSKSSISSFFIIPTTLQTVVYDYSQITIHISEKHTIRFNKNNNLKFLSLSYSDKLILNGTILGLEKLITLNIAHINDVSLSESFFDTLSSLENLFMSFVTLPKRFFNKLSIRLFKNLTNLKTLDLSSSNLNYLPKYSFQNNRRLKQLFLSNNKFENCSLSIEDTPHLEVLDLSYNYIYTFDQDTRNALDKHATHNPSFKLYIKGNELSCRCENIDFILWLKQTKYVIDSNHTHCISETDKWVVLKEIDDEALWHECTGKPAFYIVSAAFALVISAALLSFIVVKHKTQLLVFLHTLFRGVRGLPARGDFKYDVFVGYADQDYRFACTQLRQILEERFHYRIYLHDRDSQLGDSRANNILDGVRNSWKMVLVLSENFVSEDWCMYTMHAVALYTVSRLVPRRLVILLDRDNPCRVPDTLLCAVDEDAILPIPHLHDDDAWEHLSRLLN